MKDMTLINVIFDRSGSMWSIAPDAVGMFNSFLSDQKKGEDYAELSLVQFSDEYLMQYSNVPIKECRPLVLGETYNPRGLTALYDAIGKTIDSVGRDLNALKEDERPQRVSFMIISDGEDNRSVRYSAKTIAEMIDHQKTKYNWDFTFYGSGIDAEAEGIKFGMEAAKCATFAGNARGINDIGNTMTAYATSYRSTGDVTMHVNDFRG